MKIDKERGTGRTTEQMRAAPIGAIFISPHAATIGYNKSLAAYIDRKDLKVVSTLWLEEGWRGVTLTGIVIDHAANLNDRQQNLLVEAQSRIRGRD
jgi:hypothetical protein